MDKLKTLFHWFTNLFLAAALLLAAAVWLPPFFHMKAYVVASSSMEPAITAGSVVYVSQYREDESISTGDIVSFQAGDAMVTHRIVSVDREHGMAVTKGDANRTEDLTPTPYGSLIGKEVFHLPYAGGLMTMLSGTAGKVYAVLFAVCGVLLRMLGGILEKQGGKKEDGV